MLTIIQYYHHGSYDLSWTHHIYQINKKSHLTIIPKVTKSMNYGNLITYWADPPTINFDTLFQCLYSTLIFQPGNSFKKKLQKVVIFMNSAINSLHINEWKWHWILICLSQTKHNLKNIETYIKVKSQSTIHLSGHFLNTHMRKSGNLTSLNSKLTNLEDKQIKLL